MSAASLICRKPVGRSPALAPSASSALVSRTLGAGVARIVARHALMSPTPLTILHRAFSRTALITYHPVPCAPLATESHFDAKRPQKGLRSTQPSGERAGVSWPVCAPPRDGTTTGKIGRGTQKSDAVPVHVLRLAMISRTQEATGSLSMTLSIAALRFAS